jgi:hypothetical protein
MNYYETKNHLTQQIDPTRHKTLFILAAENSADDAEYLVNFANYYSINISGGIFPKVISDGVAINKGLIAGIYETATQSYFIDPEADKNENLKLCSEIGQNYDQAFLLVDGLSPHISSLLRFFNQHIGKQVTFAGGGAGYSGLRQKPCLFNNKGFRQDVALIFPTNHSFSLNMENGWEPLGPTLISNKTDANYLVEFNWRNAFSYYSYLIENTTGEKIDAATFSKTSSNYPVGIYTGDEQYSIRDLVSVNDQGHIATTTNVNEHTMLSLMHGNPDKLIAAARRLREQNLELLQQGDQLIYFHCLSREFCLGTSFQQELELLSSEISKQSQNPVVGVLSIGEIASSHHGNIIFQNKSIVSNITKNE